MMKTLKFSTPIFPQKIINSTCTSITDDISTYASAIRSRTNLKTGNVLQYVPLFARAQPKSMPELPASFFLAPFASFSSN